jgi:hypothetical protein
VPITSVSAVALRARQGQAASGGALRAALDACSRHGLGQLCDEVEDFVASTRSGYRQPTPKLTEESRYGVLA